MMQPPIFEVAAVTHRGLVRSQNEDCVAIDRKILTPDTATPWIGKFTDRRHIFIVADGMGGHTHGALASRTAVEALVASPKALFEIESCLEAVLAANVKLYDMMHRIPGTFGMGTTVVGVAFDTEAMIYFNVGDSRGYCQSGAKLTQLTIDDVPIAAAGKNFRGRVSHQITQSLGGQLMPKSISPHIGLRSALVPGEITLLCSDGLTDLVSDEEIETTLNRSSDDLGSCASQLLSRALRAGGTDNISLILIRARATSNRRWTAG